MLPAGHIVQGRYQVEQVLGEGGMGSVYLTRDTRLPRRWALKEMADSFDSAEDRALAEESFVAEAQILAGLNHPNLPRVVDFFQENGRHFLVMDFIDGTTLEKRLQNGTLPIADSIKLGADIAQVLEYLHSQPQPVIFRDLKPANIILTEQGRPVLVDFGIARVFRQGSHKDTRALGTPGYAAPEQYGRGQSDHRTDLYALGATLHHCLSGVDPGEKPFQFAPLSSLRADVPPALERIVARAVSLKPEDRFQSAHDLRQALEGVERELSRSGALPRSPKTSELEQLAVQPPTLTAPPASAPPAGVAAGFRPGSVHLGKVDWGGQLRTEVVLQGEAKGKLVCDSPWMRTVPAKVAGTDSNVTVYVDTRKLAEGGKVAGLVRVQGKNSPASPLRVEVEVLPRPLPGWCWPSQIFLLLWALLPLVGLVATPLMFGVSWSAPRRHRTGLSFLAWTAGFITFCWSALIGVGVGLLHIDWKAWLHQLGLI